MAASTAANSSANSSSRVTIGGLNASSSFSTGSGPSTSGCVASACPALPRSASRPAADNAQPGSAPAMRRRAASTACAWLSSWVGVRTSMPASCSTRSSMWTSWPSSKSAAQASAKCVLAIQPSRIGLVRSRSSSRASASSALASGRASSDQGSGSGRPALKGGIGRLASRGEDRS